MADGLCHKCKHRHAERLPCPPPIDTSVLALREEVAELEAQVARDNVEIGRLRGNKAELVEDCRAAEAQLQTAREFKQGCAIDRTSVGR